jgi:chromosome segregation ATPase
VTDERPPDDVYLATSLELLERRAEALAGGGEHAALLELIATVRRHAAAMREHLREVGSDELDARVRALADRADALERRERELREAEAALAKDVAARQAESDAQAEAVFAHAREHAESVAAVDAALASRSEELAAADAELAAQRQALEEREQELAARAAELDERGGELEPAPVESEEATHLLFVPGPDGYDLVEREGPSPECGERVVLGERELVVVKVAGSPLPGDRRLCAYLV